MITCIVKIKNLHIEKSYSITILCGKQKHDIMQYTRPRSNWWFLLPILLGLIGGIIAYFVLRNDDPGKAKNCLYLGVALAIVGIAMSFFLGSQIPELDSDMGFEVR